MISHTRVEARPDIQRVASDLDAIASDLALLERADDERPAIPLSKRYRIISAGLVASDGMCALIAVLVAHATLFGFDVTLSGLLPQMAVALAAWIGSFHAFGLYHVRHLSALEEFRRLIGATCVATSLVILIRASANVQPHRRWLGLTWLLALGFELGIRRLWRWRIRRLRESGHLAARTVILGTNEEAARLTLALRPPALGFHVLGHIATDKEKLSPRLVPVLGDLDQLDRTIRALGVEALFVASTAVSVDDMVRVAQVARRADVEMRMSANMADVLVSRLSVQSFDGVLALSVKPVRMSATQAAIKRTFDLCLASIALVALLPVMAVVTVAVRLSSPGPVLFRQDRVTKDGRLFVMLKFRTMVTMAQPVVGDQLIDVTVPFFKLEHDPRITAVGRLLREFSLDELPQLWQVIRGDLSLVGPRPLPADQVTTHQELLGPRHEVRAGITGWWQINGRSGVDPDQALRMDLFYIENWSLSLDLFILLKTVGTVLSRRGAC
jgi:exopolysaccharide biosynthesis polyprenyl glycosylphosphotransferase